MAWSLWLAEGCLAGGRAGWPPSIREVSFFSQRSPAVAIMPHRWAPVDWERGSHWQEGNAGQRSLVKSAPVAPRVAGRRLERPFTEQTQKLRRFNVWVCCSYCTCMLIKGLHRFFPLRMQTHTFTQFCSFSGLTRSFMLRTDSVVIGVIRPPTHRVMCLPTHICALPPATRSWKIRTGARSQSRREHSVQI